MVIQYNLYTLDTSRKSGSGYYLNESFKTPEEREAAIKELNARGPYTPFERRDEEQGQEVNYKPARPTPDRYPSPSAQGSSEQVQTLREEIARQENPFAENNPTFPFASNGNQPQPNNVAENNPTFPFAQTQFKPADSNGIYLTPEQAIINKQSYYENSNIQNRGVKDKPLYPSSAQNISINIERNKSSQETIDVKPNLPNFQEDKIISSTEHQYTPSGRVEKYYTSDYADTNPNTISFNRAYEKAAYKDVYEPSIFSAGAVGLLEGVGIAEENLKPAAFYSTARAVLPVKVSQAGAVGLTLTSIPSLVGDVQKYGVVRGAARNLLTFGLFAGAEKGGSSINLALRTRASNIKFGYNELIDTNFQYNPNKEVFIPTEETFRIVEGKPVKIIETERIQRGFPVFNEEGVINGRQMQLKPSYNPYAEPQAEFMPEILSDKNIMQGQNDYLGKYFARPLSPNEVSSIQSLPEAVEIKTETQKVLTPITRVQKGGINFYQINQEPIITTRRGLFAGKKSQLSFSPDFENMPSPYEVFEKYGGNYYNKNIKPIIEIIPERITMDKSISEVNPKPFFSLGSEQNNELKSNLITYSRINTSRNNLSAIKPITIQTPRTLSFVATKPAIQFDTERIQSQERKQISIPKQSIAQSLKEDVIPIYDFGIFPEPKGTKPRRLPKENYTPIKEDLFKFTPEPSYESNQFIPKQSKIKRKRSYLGVPSVANILGAEGTKLTKAQKRGGYINPFQVRAI